MPPVVLDIEMTVTGGRQSESRQLPVQPGLLVAELVAGIDADQAAVVGQALAEPGEGRISLTGDPGLQPDQGGDLRRLGQGREVHAAAGRVCLVVEADEHHVATGGAGRRGGAEGGAGQRAGARADALGVLIGGDLATIDEVGAQLDLPGGALVVVEGARLAEV